jgi:hypothetical protein
MAKRPDFAALVAGLLVAAFGIVLLLDAAGDLHLRLAALGPIAALICGGTVLASGLSRRD